MMAENCNEDRVLAMLPAQPPNTVSRVLIVIPGTVNYFYNQLGRRVAEALRELRIQADIRTLDECDAPDLPSYDWCVLSNLYEILVANGELEVGVGRVRQLLNNTKAGGVGLALDCVRTHWYGQLHEYHLEVGASDTLDLGLTDQAEFLRPQHRSHYQFVFNGVTESERELALVDTTIEATRPFPWAFVGHMTHHRIGLIDHLVQTVDPKGFVYVPVLSTYTENGPHLNQQQFEQILRRTHYQVWCSSHDNFYMEPERFRTSLLTGGVPVKVIEDYQKVPENVPFRHLLVPRDALGERLTDDAFTRMRGLFRNEFLAMPSLADSFAKLLTAKGMRLPQPLEELKPVREPLRLAG